MFQAKEQQISPKKEMKVIDKMEATPILDAEFKKNGYKDAQRPQGKIDDLSENINKEIVSFKKDIETINMNQLQMKITTPETKHFHEGSNSRLDEAKDQISELEEKIIVHTQRKNKNKKRLKRNEKSIRHLWDNIRHNNIHIIGVPE